MKGPSRKDPPAITAFGLGARGPQMVCLSGAIQVPFSLPRAI